MIHLTMLHQFLKRMHSSLSQTDASSWIVNLAQKQPRLSGLSALTDTQRTKKLFRSGNRNQEQMHFLYFALPCGDEGIRTPDLLRAKEALSQLSYIP